MTAIHILIGGDVCPRGESVPYFMRGDAGGIFHDLLDDLKNADVSIVNLECPLTDSETPIHKNGPNLRAPEACISGLRHAGIHVLNLANNHIMDHGPEGLDRTMTVVKSAGIAMIGAGRNLEEARRIHVRSIGDVRIGILSIAEHEFSIAGANSPGANPLDLIDIVRNIAAHREEWDYLIVLLHGGNEGYPFPSPRLMNTCRFLVEQGANAVICQHSHCVGCRETYHGGHIVYGQGNFVFASSKPCPGWNEGVLVQLCLSSDGKSNMELIPFDQSHGQPGARKMSPDAAKALLQIVAERSEQIQDGNFVREQWKRFCAERKNYYMSKMLGHGRILTRLNRRGSVVRWCYSNRALLGASNSVQCEAHREVLETIFESHPMEQP